MIRIEHRAVCCCDDCGKEVILEDVKSVERAERELRRFGWSVSADKKFYCEDCKRIVSHGIKRRKPEERNLKQYIRYEVSGERWGCILSWFKEHTDKDAFKLCDEKYKGLMEYAFMNPPLSLAEIGDMYGYTRENVRQVISRQCKKIGYGILMERNSEYGRKVTVETE